MDNWGWLLLIGGAVLGGVLVYYLVKGQPASIPLQSPAYAYGASPSKVMENEETWDMWEDKEGHLHAVIHRKVHT